jgi:PPOX class probable FMN-dependent enzyme
METCLIESRAALRNLISEPLPANLKKSIDHIDPLAARFIALSPFLTIASCNAAGEMDVSPKGDPPGFVQVLDQHRLAIPERPGNRRCDTFENVLQNSAVGLVFLVPGMEETLRVNGTATITADPEILAPMAIRGKAPQLALIVAVAEVFIHCGKAIKRARLWHAGSHIDRSVFPTMGDVVHAHASLAADGISADRVNAFVERDYETNVY